VLAYIVYCWRKIDAQGTSQADIDNDHAY